MLGLHPDIQRRVRQEVDSVMDLHSDGEDFTIEDIKQLKYLECVLKEVQRLFPTAPFIGRQLSEDTIISELWSLLRHGMPNMSQHVLTCSRRLFSAEGDHLRHLHIHIASRQRPVPQT